MTLLEQRPERIYVIPRDIDEVLEIGGVEHLPDGSGITFDCTQSDFALLIASTANFASVFAAGAIEAGHPGIAHGLIAHESLIFQETMQRIGRAAVGIGSIATAQDARVAGMRIRDFHSGIMGKNVAGETVPATDPKLYADGFLPIEWMMVESALRLGFSADRLRRLHQEALIAYQCQGVSDEFMPKSYDEFCERMRQYFEQTEKTEAIDRFRDGGISCPPVIPKVLWNVPAVRSTINGISQASTVHALPGSLAERYSYHVVPKRHKVVASTFATACTLIAKYGPRIMRMHPHIYEHRHPPKTIVGRTAIRGSWKMTNRFLGSRA